MRSKILFLILILMSGTTIRQVVAEGTCPLDGGLTPQLAQYVRDINTISSKLKQLPSTCGPKSNGIVSNTRRTIDIIDKAKAENTVMNNLGVDFDYNIKGAFNGDSRDAVIQNGKVFQQVEQILISTLDTLANKCAIDTVVDGVTAEQIIIGKIRINDALETIYKCTTIGTCIVQNDATNSSINLVEDATKKIPQDGLYPELIKEITENYNPKSTQGCKNQFSFENMSETILKKIGNLSLGIDSSLTNWKYAIALIRGGSSMKQEQYSDLKKKLLTEELRRQGYSAGAIDQMVKGYTCMEGALKGGDGPNEKPMDFAQARQSCAQKSIIGEQRFMREWSKMIVGSKGAKTIVQYINRVSTYNTVVATDTSVIDIYGKLDSDFAKNSGVDNGFLTKFINLHIVLLDVNDRLEKRIAPMIANCRKAQPDIVCNF